MKKQRGRIVIISGPSGSGKTTLHQKLLASRKLRGKLVKSISATTRARRPGEKDGRDYLFLTRKQFLHRIRIGYFLEWEKVFDNYYGTPKKKVEALLHSGRNVLLCIDVRGAGKAVRQFPDAITVFIKTPSLKILRKRLRARASEGDESLKLRLQRAKKELREAKRYRHVVVNDHLGRAFRRLEAIIVRELKAGRVR